MKIRNLYADLGLTHRQVSHDQIRVAYKILALKFHPDKKGGAGSIGTADFEKIQHAYEILGDPAKRAKYDESYKRRLNNLKIAKNAKGAKDVKKRFKHEYKPMYPEQWRQEWRARGERDRTLLLRRSQAHWRTKAHKQELETREIHREPDQAKRELWNEQKAFIQKVDKQYYQREKDFLNTEMSYQAVQRRQEEVDRAREAAAQALGKEVGWIISESKQSILVLSLMVKQPENRAAPAHIKKLEGDYARHLVQRADDLLNYLWSKAISGRWITAEIRDAIKLDRLLGVVSQAQEVDSYFPSAMRQSATSLLDVWCHENWGEPGKGRRPSPNYRKQAPPPPYRKQARQQPWSGFLSSSRGGPKVNASSQDRRESQPTQRAPEQQKAALAPNMQRNSVADMDVPRAGAKRSRGLNTDKAQEEPGAKRQRLFGVFRSGKSNLSGKSD
ncbi:hypothetical protein Daus18300_000182 [Diaporthe australafricana]|uniref:J domain-containing protein n=1 Tax=Diaporthe australafricana TaxID=127596 RepID=A0ABR3Y7P4_9PEZI